MDNKRLCAMEPRSRWKDSPCIYFGTLKIIIIYLFFLFNYMFFYFIFVTAAILDAPICVNLNGFHTKMILTVLSQSIKRVRKFTFQTVV